MRRTLVGCLVGFFLTAGNVVASECGNKPVLEVVTFSLAPTASAGELRKAALVVEAELKKMKGFKRRELAQSEAGAWIDIVYWDSLSAAKSAALAMETNTAASGFFGAMDAASVVVNYYCH